MPGLVARVLVWGLRLTRLYAAGYRNFLDVRVVENEVRLDRLPVGLDGLRVLQMSDLHLNLDPALTPVLIRLVGPLEYDAAVLTGDFENSFDADHRSAMEQLLLLRPSLRGRVYAILGNHDNGAMVADMEAMGIRVLRNQSELLADGLVLTGLDCYFAVPDWQALRPAGCSIILSHSPYNYRQAATAGFDLFLTGHTHGGQICLPGGIAIIRLGHCPAQMLKGAWQYGQMRGYTSPGTGSCGAPIRFYCPPEITIHTLRRSKPSGRGG